MKKSFILLGLIVLISISTGNHCGIAAEKVQTPKTSHDITNLQLIYDSKAINEVPFFASDCIVLESGDNHNDFLVVIPVNGYEITPENYRDPNLFTELENPRPVVPDSNQLVFSAIGKNGKKGIYLMNKFDSAFTYNASKKPPVALLVNQDNNWHPSFNSQEGILMFVSDARGTPQIFIYNLKTKISKQITYLAKASSPFLDAKAEWVYFTGVDQHDNSDIYKVKPDGSGLTRLTFSPEIERYPTLTKYGKWIVYERGTKTERGIWIMSPDGKIQKQISDPRHWASNPCMNYSGTKIVFEGMINNKKGIYLGELPDATFAGATAAEFHTGLDVEKEVVNLSQFGNFTPAQLAKLSEYGFFAVPTEQKQLFYTYEENEYRNIPSFVTADNLLQLLHINFDTSLRKTEEQSLLPKLRQLTQAVILELEKRKSSRNEASYLSLKRYFYVLYQLVFNKPYSRATSSDRQIVAAELGKIKNEQPAVSAVFPESQFDYSLFKVRGHYTNSPALSSYFKAMSWIGLITFDTKTSENRRRIYLASELLTANPQIRNLYDNIYTITAFYVGESDSPNFYDLAEYWRKTTGTPLSYKNYNDRKMQQVLVKLFLEKPSRIETFYRDPRKNQTQVIGLMGQRYVADSHLFSLLFKNLGRQYLPGGLDLFTALGNQTAYTILKDETDTFKKYPDYEQIVPEGKKIFTRTGQAPQAPLFSQWMNLLKIYTNSTEPGTPAVLASPHWKKKKLTSALASWAELKHDTILYGKQTAAECGGGDEPPKVYGYIEPELTFYKSLRQTLVSMDIQLKKRNAVGIHGLKQLRELVDFFILVSEKELAHIPLSTQENEQIRIIGGLLEAQTISALDTQMDWWNITSESAKNMAVVADIFSYWGKYQIEGVGYADDLYVIIPVNGQLYLMRGAIFSHYEFLNDKRLNDSEWYEKLKTFSIEKRSKWWQPYLDGKKSKIPVPADPYDSGC